MNSFKSLAIALLFPMLANAQSTSTAASKNIYTSRQLYVGPTVGAKLSTVTFFDEIPKDLYQSTPAFGYDVGIMVSRRIKELYCLNASLLYSQRGKTITKKADPDFRIIQRNRYIEIPIYYTLEFKNTIGNSSGMVGQRRTYKWFLGAGPTVAYWMGGKGYLQSGYLKHESNIDKLNYKIVFNKIDSLLNQTTDANLMNVSEANRFQFSVNFTGGIALEPVGFQKIVIAAHLELGQTFLSRKNGAYFPGSNVDADEVKAKYHSLRFTVSYLFDTKIENRKRGKSNIKVKDNKKKR